MVVQIVAAMESELKAIKKALNNSSSYFLNGECYYSVGSHPEGPPDPDGVKIYVDQIGVGKVNAAVGVTKLLYERGLKADLVLLAGVTAGLSSNLRVGSVVVVKTALEYDFDLTPLGLPVGTIPVPEPEGKIKVFTVGDSKTYSCIKSYKIGRCLTADRFCTEKITGFGGGEDCIIADMETAAVYHTVFLLHKKALAIRVVSDLAGSRIQAEDYIKNEALACARLGAVVAELVDGWSKMTF